MGMTNRQSVMAIGLPSKNDEKYSITVKEMFVRNSDCDTYKRYISLPVSWRVNSILEILQIKSRNSWELTTGSRESSQGRRYENNVDITYIRKPERSEPRGVWEVAPQERRPYEDLRKEQSFERLITHRFFLSYKFPCIAL
jgi:hypothetical protein